MQVIWFLYIHLWKRIMLNIISFSQICSTPNYAMLLLYTIYAQSMLNLCSIYAQSMLPTMLPTMPYLCCSYTSIHALNLYLCLIYKSTMNIYEHYIINTLIYAFNAIYISITHINLITPLQMNNVFIPWEFCKSDVILIWTYMENNADGW